MSRLEELLKKLCPNGVDNVPLKEVAEFRRGSFPQPYTNASWYGGNNCMPFIQVADMLDDKFYLVEKTKQTISEVAQPKSVFVETGTVLVSLQGTIGRVAITQYDCFVDRTIAIFTKFKINDLNKKYFAYVLKQKFDIEKKYARGSTLKTITKEEFSKFTIPVPPIEVQCEIVRILDDFKELTAMIIEELTSEITARKKQYKYYKNELLAFKNTDVEWKTLDEIASEMYRGAGIKRDQVTEEGIPCVRYGEIYTTYDISFDKCRSHTDESKISSKKYFEYGDILFAITGESVEDISKSIAYLGHEKCMAGGDMVVMKHKQNPRYLSYSLSTVDAQKQKSKGKVKSKVVHSSVPSLKEIKVPVPSLEEQERVAKILDSLHSLCDDISIGIKAEIEARKKQYEYYIDKLLTFKELKDEHI